MGWAVKNFHLISINLRSKRRGEVVRQIHFVWTRPNFWLVFAGAFLVRDIHWMFQRHPLSEFALLSALIWSVLASLSRNKLYAPYEDAWKVVKEERRGAP